MIVPLARLEIDAFRGERNHLLASDVLSIAPLSTDLRRFEFRFRKPARHPGYWARIGDHHTSLFTVTVATLRLYFSTRSEDWEFVVDTSRTVLKHLEDLDEASMCAALTIQQNQSDLPMSDQFTLWEYVVASARRFFPHTTWHFAYLHAQYENCQRATHGTHLRMLLRRERSNFVEFEFFLDNTFAGSFGARRRGSV